MFTALPCTSPETWFHLLSHPTIFPSFPSSHLGLCQQPKNLILQLYQAIPTSIGVIPRWDRAGGAAHIVQTLNISRKIVCVHEFFRLATVLILANPMNTEMLKVVHAESPQVGLTITISPFWSSLQFAAVFESFEHLLTRGIDAATQPLATWKSKRFLSSSKRGSSLRTMTPRSWLVRPSNTTMKFTYRQIGPSWPIDIFNIPLTKYRVDLKQNSAEEKCSARRDLLHSQANKTKKQW